MEGFERKKHIVGQHHEQPEDGSAISWDLLIALARTHSELETSAEAVLSKLQESNNSPVTGRELFGIEGINLTSPHNSINAFFSKHNIPYRLVIIGGHANNESYMDQSYALVSWPPKEYTLVERERSTENLTPEEWIQIEKEAFRARKLSLYIARLKSSQNVPLPAKELFGETDQVVINNILYNVNGWFRNKKLPFRIQRREVKRGEAWENRKYALGRYHVTEVKSDS